jgi:hypothetical protein
MKSKSINSEMKSTIVHAALAMRVRQLCDGGTDAREYINNKMRNLGDEVYKELFTAPDRRRMAALPDGWLAKRDYICVSVSTPYECTDSCPRNCAGDHAHTRRIDFVTTTQVLLPFWAFNTELKLPEGSPMLKTLREIERERREIERDLNSVKDQAWAVLDPIRSLKVLLERWPEVRKLDLPPEILRETEGTAIIVRPDNLNVVLGLAQ